MSPHTTRPFPPVPPQPSPCASDCAQFTAGGHLPGVYSSVVRVTCQGPCQQGCCAAYDTNRMYFCHNAFAAYSAIFTISPLPVFAPCALYCVQLSAGGHLPGVYSSVARVTCKGPCQQGCCAAYDTNRMYFCHIAFAPYSVIITISPPFLCSMRS